MKKRLAICLLALGSLTAVSVNAYNNNSSSTEPQEVAQYTPAPCDTVPCNPCDTVCAPAPCTPAPCNPGC